MAYSIPLLDMLTEQFRKFPGVGKKSAQRMAFSVLEMNDEAVDEFVNILTTAKSQIHQCSRCFNLCTGDLCSVCSDSERDGSIICVVEDVKSLMSIENVREFNGVYHVLHGALSPMNGIGPDMLKINELIERVANGGVNEVILATNPTSDGETTALYLGKLLKPFGVKVSLLASGLPAGGDLEYVDELTLHRALSGRHELD